MSDSIILVEPTLAQTPTSAPQARSGQFWMYSSVALVLVLVGLGVYTKLQIKKLKKEKRFEEYKNRELQKKLKLALNTISKMEKNPDLIHSREFNLDYLRMRMAEDQFHFAIVNQIKIRVKEKITVALRPTQAEQGTLGIASTSRKVDEIFDVNYNLSTVQTGKKGVLFRIQIKLSKIPTQPTSTTISQIIDCMTTFMSQDTDDSWQPTLQGRIAYMHWDQKAKPTPLLVLEQSNEGVNVTFRSSRITEPTNTVEGTKPKASKARKSASKSSRSKRSSSKVDVKLKAKRS
ncbi:MAG: hypothetical protein AAFY26_11215 [Cyanobacteria bacterium J06638_22]